MIKGDVVFENECIYINDKYWIDTLIKLMDEYYTGSFSPIGELAGEISAVLPWDED